MPFDACQWAHTLPGLEPDQWGNIVVPYIVGPRDVCTILKLRERLGPRVSFRMPVQTDFFILATGEPELRLSTKIGGLPYWRSNRPWPVSQSGAPIPFLAQFDLSTSRDLVGDVPWDIILVFADLDAPRAGIVDFEKKCDSSKLITQHEMPIDTSMPRYSCTRWRTSVFPDWEPLNGDSLSDFEFADGSVVRQVYFVMEPLGMQIGRSPFIPSGTPVKDSDEVILCSIPSIAPFASRPYPFLNREAPLTPTEAESAQIIVTELGDDDGFGVLYVVVTSDGSLALRFTDL